MCKIGDIILVDHYKHGSKSIGKHSFVVIGDDNGSIQGMNYDLLCNVLSSIKSDEQRKRKLKYPGNFPIANEDTLTDPNNGKNSYIKTDQIYLFNKSKLQYHVIGYIKPDILDLIVEFINESDFEREIIMDNL